MEYEHIKKRAYDREDWHQWRPVYLPEKAQHSREIERERQIERFLSAKNN